MQMTTASGNTTGNRTFLRWARSGDGWPVLFTIGIGLTLVVMLGMVLLGIRDVPLPPPGVASEFYEAASTGDAETAEEFLSQEALAEYRQLSPADQEAFLSQAVDGKRIEDQLPLGVRNYGSRAVVGVLLIFDDNSSLLRTDEVVRDGSRWKLTLPLGERRWNDLVEPYDRTRNTTPTSNEDPAD